MGDVIGAIGIVLFDQPETTLQPLISKFALLQRDLDDARRELASQRANPLYQHAPDGQRRSKYTFASFIGSSPAAVEVKRHARRAAQSASPVLLLGETGTGKELLAHAIHASSARAKGQFVSVNIAAVPDTLLEAEFFGFAPGAFTGADRKGREGKFKLADGGSLFLDEIGDMPLGLQAKLLRALQEGEIEPLGSNKLVPFDARVIAATSRDLPELVREASSAKTCTTASTCCRCACRRCASGAPTFPRWSRRWARTWPAQRRGPARADARRARLAGRAALARQHPRAAQRAGAGDHAQRLAAHRRRAARAHPARSRAGADRAARHAAERTRRRPGSGIAAAARAAGGRAGAQGDCGGAGVDRRQQAGDARLLGISRATLYERMTSQDA
jgi:hypothetical protein